MIRVGLQFVFSVGVLIKVGFKIFINCNKKWGVK